MTSSRVPPSVLSARGHRRPLGLAVLAAWLACAWPLTADDPPPADAPLMSAPMETDEVWELTPSNSGSISGGNPAAKPAPESAGGFGINARLIHIAEETIDSDESRTGVELSPFTTIDSLFLGADLRFLRTNTGDYGGSAGGIVRRYLPDANAIIGANLFFDIDHTHGAQFQQVGLGFEWLSNRFDHRTNIYIPFGTDQKVLSRGVVAGSESFVGNALYYSQFSNQTTVATGLDTMFTMPLPGRIAERLNLEVSGGAYYFNPNDGKLRDFAGPKFRLDGTLARRLLHMYTEVTHDNVNDTLVSVGVDVNYWNRYDDQPRIGGNQFHRITEWVRRNWSMVATDETKIADGIIAFDPTTGLPYVIEHVDTNATALPGNGTFERPYTTLQQAQLTPPNAPNTITYVHAGSVFNAPLLMNPGEIIVGEGTTFSLPLLASPDTVLLPGTGKPGGRPNFDNITGVPVTLANDVTFAGFTISSTTNGPAIFGNGITNARLEDIDIQDVNNGNGIQFLDSHGRITLDNVNVLRSNPADPNTGADLDAFRVEGGDATIVYTNSRIENTLGRGVRITNAGGVVDLRSTTVNSRFTVTANNDDGVIVQNSSADVIFGPLELQSGTIDLLGITGDVTFAGPVQLDNSQPNPENAAGFPIQVNGSTGAIVFNPGATVVINNRPDYAIDLRNISGSIRFHDDITIEGASGLGVFDGGLIWQQNSGDFIMDGLFSVDSAAEAILIGDAAGVLSNLDGSTFTMNGQFNITNGTLFSTGDIEILNDPTDVTFNGGTNTDRTLKNAILVFNTTGDLTFNGLTQINGTFAEFDSAVDIQQAQGPVVFDTLTIVDDAAVGNADPRVFIDNSGNITFNELNVDQSGGTLTAATTSLGAVVIQNSGLITSNGGVIRATGAGGGGANGQAIRLIDNNRIAWTSDAISAQEDTVGILVSGQPGFFVVRGNGNVGGGGSVQGNTGASAGIDTGAIFDWTGEDPTDTGNFVELHDMIFSANERAIVATNLNRLVLDNLTVQNTSTTGSLLLSNIVNLTIEDSRFTNNFGNVINSTVSINPVDTTFTYRFLRNQFVDGAGTNNSSMIRLDNIGAGAGATLDLVVSNNGAPTSGLTGFVSNRNNPNIANPNLVDESSAFAVRWNGPVTQALFERNSFALIGGAGQEGLEFVNADSSAHTNFTFRENTLTANEAADAIGVRLDLAGPANVNILNNRLLNTPGQPFQGFIMNGLRAQAYQLALRNAGTTVRLEDNDIQFFNDDAIGFNFPFIGGNTNLAVNGNLIQFKQQFSAVGPGERGFAFGPVAGTVNFSGNRNNKVEYTQPDAFSRAFPNPFIGAHTGTIFINSQRVPQ